MECVIRMRETSGSGSAETRRSKVAGPQETKPAGGDLRLPDLPDCLIRLARSASSLTFANFAAALRSAALFSITCSGAWTTTVPEVSKPARPARPAIWWNSRAWSRRVFSPSNLDSAVSSTVRIGTLIPTPSVSVPQMTLSSPSWASFSTRRRYLGSMPAWCTPMPARTRRFRVCPKPAENRKPAIRAAIASFSSLDVTEIEDSPWAVSTASSCEKCTMYTGAWWVLTSSSTFSCSGTSDHSNVSGMGRSAWATTATSRPVRSVRSASRRVVSPRVADIRRNRACGSSRRGTCQAQPREGSA